MWHAPTREIFNLNFLSRTCDETPFTFTWSSKLHSADQRQISLLRNTHIRRYWTEKSPFVYLRFKSYIFRLKRFSLDKLFHSWTIFCKTWIWKPALLAVLNISCERHLQYKDSVNEIKILYMHTYVCVYIL